MNRINFGTDEFVIVLQIGRREAVFGGKCAFARRRQFLWNGSNTAIRLRIRQRGRRNAREKRFSAAAQSTVIGVSATNRGVAAAIFSRKNTPKNFANLRLGCRLTAFHLKLIGSGPNGGDINWTRKFFEKLARKRRGGKSRNFTAGRLHYYSGSTGQQIANEFTENEWYDLLERSDRMEKL